jgi:flagellar assembly factor FliW
MKIESTRFGAIEVSEDRLFTFPEGFPAFQSRRWALVDVPKMPIVWWLQAVEEPGIALLITDPSQIKVNFTAGPKPSELRAIQPNGPSDRIACRVVVRSGELPGEIFINLFAPIYLNLDRRLGMQVPLVGSGHSVKEAWPPRPAEKPEQGRESDDV